MTRSTADIGAGLLPARPARPIPPRERIHVMGAAGAGASAACLLAAAAGASASGCDPGGPSPYTASIEAADIPLSWAHDPGHVTDGVAPTVDRVAVTKALTAVTPDHPELLAARAVGVPTEPWQQVVADAHASHGGRLIAVAGTHGKSTSTGWLVHVLTATGHDPAAFVGALLPAALTGGIPATARWGRGDAFVVEADEYAGNFDAYRPEIAVVLNAEWDHPDVFRDETAVLDAFEGWLRAPGADHRTLIANTGDPGVARLVGRLGGWPGSLVTASLDVAGVTIRGSLTDDGVLSVEGLPGTVRALRCRPTLPGRHNAANALCVVAAATLAGADPDAIADAVGTFSGVGRRLEVKGEPGGVLVIDDYGHHPTAIAASLAAVRSRWPGRRLWAVYEPLTYHRTAAMLDGFADVLATADQVLIADIWAGRDPDTTLTSAGAVARAIQIRGGAPASAPGSAEDTADRLAECVVPGDVVLVMGGGRSYVIAERLVGRLGG